MSSIKLYGYAENARSRIALAVANKEGVEVEVIRTTQEEKGEEFKSKFPMAKIPALEHGDVKIFEVTAVAYYLASVNRSTTQSSSLLQTAKNAIGLGSPSLLGNTVAEQATVLQWVSWANNHLLPTGFGWWAPLAGKAPYNKKAVEEAETATKALLKILNDRLLTNTYLASERITLADIFVTSFIGRSNEFVFGKAIREAYPNVFRLFATVANQPWYSKVAGGAPTYIENPIVYTPPAKTEKKKEEKAKADKPKAEKKKPAADEEEDDTPKEVKPKHPIEALGPAKSFPLDEWKRQYSNLDTPDALKWFDAHYDPQDYSLWLATYKYPEELTQVFMSANLITGFHTRLEASRKFLFGSAGVYGTNNNSAIQGVYLVRGPNGLQAFDVAPDYESYDFKPLNWSDPADRKLVEDAWKWEGTVDGKEYADGKIFK